MAEHLATWARPGAKTKEERLRSILRRANRQTLTQYTSIGAQKQGRNRPRPITLPKIDLGETWRP